MSEPFLAEVKILGFNSILPPVVLHYAMVRFYRSTRTRRCSLCWGQTMAVMGGQLLACQTCEGAHLYIMVMAIHWGKRAERSSTRLM
jgi:hypothetical protein